MSRLTQVTGIPKKPDGKKQNENQDFYPGVTIQPKTNRVKQAMHNAKKHDKTSS